MNFKQHRDFVPSLRSLFQRGGLFKKSAEQVQALLGRITVEECDPFKGMNLTHQGETRIKKCRKYDLYGYARLITVQNNGIVLFCYVGCHDDCDKWLESNRGLTLVADEHNQLNTVQMTLADDPPGNRLTGETALTMGKLYEKLPNDCFDRLTDNVPFSVANKLSTLESINDEKSIYEAVENIADKELSLAIYESFVLLRQDKCQQALDRIKVYFGQSQLTDNLTEEEISALADSETIKTIAADDPRFQKVFEHFVNSASYMDWMLFLHPDQEKIVKQDFSGPAKLLGVSGSGKTCIVVQRAVRLAEKYPSEKILVLTLNRPLSRLIADMVDAACLKEIRENIDVMPFFGLCQKLLHDFDPTGDKLYDDKTWKSKEHIDEVWREFYRCELNNHDAAILSPIHDSLIARSVDAEQYIREEFDWIRSALPLAKRQDYLVIERSGRSYPLDIKARKLVLDGLSAWEKKMRLVGVTDYLGISAAIYKYLGQIKALYRCVLVDESQDFGTIECEIIKKIVYNGENNLFFCGDAAQQVSAKHRSFRDAGIDIPPSNCTIVQKNYRNSREILQAAYDVLESNVLQENAIDEMLKASDFEILDPEYANFSSAPPLMLKCNNLENELAYALGYIQQELSISKNKKACLAICGYSTYQVQKYGLMLGVPVLDENITIEDGNIYLSDLEHTKGFEFDTIIITNCNADVIPDILKPEKEQFRDLARFYVAMTRAKSQLIVSYSIKQSPLLANAEKYFLQDDWSYHVPDNLVVNNGVPPSLDQIRTDGENTTPRHPFEMTGPEFLYTPGAIGLPNLLIEKLRNVIPGRSTIREGSTVAWTTIGRAKLDTDTSARSRQAFGPEGMRQFRELIAGFPEYKGKNPKLRQ